MKKLFLKKSNNSWKRIFLLQFVALMGVLSQKAYSRLSLMSLLITNMKKDSEDIPKEKKKKNPCKIHFKKRMTNEEDLLAARYYDEKGKLLPMIPEKPSIMGKMIEKLGTRSHSIGVCSDNSAVTFPAAKEASEENHLITLKNMVKDCQVRGSVLVSSYIP